MIGPKTGFYQQNWCFQKRAIPPAEMRRKLLKHGWGILMTSKPRIKLAFF